MIVHLNGWPGAGKLTVGRSLARRLGGLLLDNHAILNLPAALTAPGSPEFHGTARAVRTVAFDRILALPPSTPVVLTNVVARGGTSSGFIEENWHAVLQLVARRGCKLFAVTLTCSPQANAERIVRLDRQARGKIDSPEILRELVATRVLFDDGATERMHLDNTTLGPDACADMIATWVVDRTSVRKCLP